MSTEAERSAHIQGAITRIMAGNPKLTYGAAYQAAMSDPANAEVVSQMKRARSNGVSIPLKTKTSAKSGAVSLTNDRSGR
jgi:hypothetical protein